MKVFLISFRTYRSLGDGEHETKKEKLLVYAERYEYAVNKIKFKYKDYDIVDKFENHTIE